MPTIEVTKPFKVVLADPNWSYQNFGAQKHGAARSHYPGSTFQELCRVPVQSWVDKDGLLFLYATWPKLLEAQLLMQVWGFDYITGVPWVKTTPSSGDIRTGIGFWFQSTSELLLVGRRGKAKAPPRGVDPVLGLLCGSERQFYAPVKEHSSKPLALYDWITEKFPGPYLELYSRNSIYGWTCWGHETGYHLDGRGCTPLSELEPSERKAMEDEAERRMLHGIPGGKEDLNAEATQGLEGIP